MLNNLKYFFKFFNISLPKVVIRYVTRCLKTAGSTNSDVTFEAHNHCAINRNHHSYLGHGHDVWHDHREQLDVVIAPEISLWQTVNQCCTYHYHDV